jgi:hypothetical protein
MDKKKAIKIIKIGKIFNILAFDNQLIILNSSYMLDDKIIEIFVNIDDFLYCIF